jgi:hypothetical protein
MGSQCILRRRPTPVFKSSGDGMLVPGKRVPQNITVIFIDVEIAGLCIFLAKSGGKDPPAGC